MKALSQVVMEQGSEEHELSKPLHPDRSKPEALALSFPQRVSQLVGHLCHQHLQDYGPKPKQELVSSGIAMTGRM